MMLNKIGELYNVVPLMRLKIILKNLYNIGGIRLF
jgi:hypothetical protein